MQNPRQVGDLQHRSIGSLAAGDVRAAALFVHLGISLADDESVTVGEACRRLGLDSAEVERELTFLDVPAGAVRAPGAPLWDLDEVCTLLVERHHARLTRACESIERRLADLAGSVSSSAIEEARAIFGEVRQHLRAHLAKEENILFPALAALARARRDGQARPALPFPTVLHPIRVMEIEHDRVTELLTRLRATAEAVVPPPGSEGDWRSCISELAAFDRSLRAHMRFEDDVLFPHALELERQLP